LYAQGFPYNPGGRQIYLPGDLEEIYQYKRNVKRTIVAKNILQIVAPGNEKGQDLAEYAMLIGLIAILVVVAVTILGTQISETLSFIALELGSWGIGG
jgi:Flp pilus assembly pilin Flp